MGPTAADQVNDRHALYNMQVGAERADRAWRAGDVCECEDAVGASLRGLGVACAGRLVPLPPGMHFKVLPRCARAGMTSHSQLLCTKIRPFRLPGRSGLGPWACHHSYVAEMSHLSSPCFPGGYRESC